LSNAAGCVHFPAHCKLSKRINACWKTKNQRNLEKEMNPRNKTGNQTKWTLLTSQSRDASYIKSRPNSAIALPANQEKNLN
jgi:hypothetical protein